MYSMKVGEMMKKYINIYLNIVTVLFCSMIIRNVREAKDILSVFHPLNLCLICLIVAGLCLLVKNEQSTK